MKQVVQRAILVTAVCVLMPGWVRGQELRLANGAVIPGEVAQVKPEGLEIRTSTGTRVYNWETLSLGTRYRYQPDFRAGYSGVLQGLPASERVKPPEEPAEKPKRSRRK